MTWGKGQKWLVFGFVAAAISTLSVYMYTQYKFLIDGISKAFQKKPSIGKINNVSLTNINILLSYNIINKGIISAEVTNQNYVVMINDMPVVNIKNNDKLLIKSKGTTKFPLEIDLKPNDLINAGMKNLASILLPDQRKNFVVRIKGNFSYEAGILTGKNYPLDIQFTLADLTS